MKRETHTAIGAVAGYLVAGLPGAGIGAVCGSLPDDIETPFHLAHRKASHSVWAVTLLVVAGVAVSGRLGVDMRYSLAVAASYAAHILADGMTISGVWWFSPVARWRLWLLPPAVRIRTGSSVDSLIGAVAGGWLCWKIIPEILFLADHLPDFDLITLLR